MAEVSYYGPNMTVDQLKEEVALFTKENICTYPASRTFREDFLACWQNHGKDVALLYAMPAVYYGVIPLPSETL